MAAPTVEDVVRDEVFDAVRRWLASTPTTPPETVLAGPVLDYVCLYREVPGLLKPLVWNAHLRELRIGSATPEAAFCDCDIVTTDDFASAIGHGRLLGRITAPLVVERRDDGWRVVDFASNGRRFLRSIRFYDRDHAVHSGGVILRPLALHLASRSTLLLLELDNRTDTEVALERAAISGRGRLGPWLRERHWAVFAGVTHVPPRSTGRLLALWGAPQVLLAKTIAIDVRLRAVGPETLVNVLLELPFATLPEPTVPAYADL